MPEVSVVVLTMGDRPGPLAEAIASARQQEGVSIEVVLVVNNARARVDDAAADVVIRPTENLGIPGGRNAGAKGSCGEFICFLDDDGILHAGALNGAVRAFREDRSLAVVGFRVVDSDGETARRHVPGIRKQPGRSRMATSFPGGASVARRESFFLVGGLCAPFQYGVEETDFAWRLLDKGWSVAYRADLRMTHPKTNPTRHAHFYFSTARNRVWLAHRTLPATLAIVYLTNWTAITLLRNLTRPRAILAHLKGSWTGLQRPIGPRSPISWRTVWRMIRLGRPPIV